MKRLKYLIYVIKCYIYKKLVHSCKIAADYLETAGYDNYANEMKILYCEMVLKYLRCLLIEPDIRN